MNHDFSFAFGCNICVEEALSNGDGGKFEVELGKIILCVLAMGLPWLENANFEVS